MCTTLTELKTTINQESLHLYLERWTRWDRSHQCWYIEWSSHQNPTRWNIRRCSTKLPKLTFLSWKVNPPHACPLLPVNSWGSSLSVEKRGKISFNQFQGEELLNYFTWLSPPLCPDLYEFQKLIVASVTRCHKMLWSDVILWWNSILVIIFSYKLLYIDQYVLSIGPFGPDF